MSLIRAALSTAGDEKVGRRNILTEDYEDPETGESEPTWPAWSRRMLTAEERRERYQLLSLLGDVDLAKRARDWRRPVFQRLVNRLVKEQLFI